MNQTTLRIAVSAAAAVALSACGSTDDGRADRLEAERDALEVERDTLEVERDALQQDLKQAQTPSWTPLSTGVHIDLTTDAESSQHTDAGVTMIESDRRGRFHVTYLVDGVEQRISMTPDDYDYNIDHYIVRGTPTYTFGGLAGSFTAAPFYRYFDVNGWEVIDDNDPATESAWLGLIVYGTPTEILPAGTADYDGEMYAERWSRTNPSLQFVYGRMELTADFDNSSIEGMFTDLETQPLGGDRVEWDADILVKGGTIADTGFSAQLEGRGRAAGVTGSATGQFFGPDAAEVGGVFSAENEDTVDTGYFGGKKTTQ